MTALLPTLDPGRHPGRVVPRQLGVHLEIALHQPTNVLAPVEPARGRRGVHRVLELGRDREGHNDVRLAGRLRLGLALNEFLRHLPPSGCSAASGITTAPAKGIRYGWRREIDTGRGVRTCRMILFLFFHVPIADVLIPFMAAVGRGVVFVFDAEVSFSGAHGVTQFRILSANIELDSR